MESNKHIQKSKCNCDNVKATSDKKQVKDNTKGEIVKYQDECKQRKVALMVSLMFTVMFVVTIYTIFCYDTTGRLLGQLLGLNM